jgi:DNA-binding NtrC family response regulator
MTTARLLIVDDEPRLLEAVARFLSGQGFDVDPARSGEEAVRLFEERRPEVAIVDHHLPDTTSVELIRTLKGIDASVPIIVLTAYGSIELAVRAIQEGADQFLTKPIELPALQALLRRLVETRRDVRVHRAEEVNRGRVAIDPFRGTSDAVRRLEEDARRAAETASPALLLGETGSGKGVLAAWIHRSSERGEQPFVDLNCAGLSRDLLESELFGHERGAFTGAHARKQGLVDLAHRGTLFLDEIGDADPLVQAKLLKVIEERAYRRVGGVTRHEVDVRFLVATHLDLERRIAESRFRADLFYRINTITIRVPSLRDRLEDIPVLCNALLPGIARDLGRGIVTLTSDAVAHLQEHSWPGNLRELRNVLEGGVLRSRTSELGRHDLRLEPSPAKAALPRDRELPADRSLRSQEQAHIATVLADEGWDVSRAALVLGISRSALYERIKKHGIRIPAKTGSSGAAA